MKKKKILFCKVGWSHGLFLLHVRVFWILVNVLVGVLVGVLDIWFGWILLIWLFTNALVIAWADILLGCSVIDQEYWKEAELLGEADNDSMFAINISK